MAVQPKTQVSISEFWTFANLPQNSDHRYMLLDGEIMAVPSNTYVSVIAIRIATLISMYLLRNNIEGHVSGADGGYIIGGNVFAPDVAYVRHLPTNKGYEDRPPLLAVEVISNPQNNNEQSTLRRKLAAYLRAGVVVWVVDFLAREVEVHAPGQPVQVFGAEDTVPGGELLPGFELAVQAIFPDAAETQDEG